MFKVVIDTNIFFVSVSIHSPYHWVFRNLQQSKYILCVTTEILLEYEEIIGQEIGKHVADYVIHTLENLPNVCFISKYYRWNLIKEDNDDNKFVDCALAENADYIVTNDNHFNGLKKIVFPKVKVITLKKFRKVLKLNI